MSIFNQKRNNNDNKKGYATIQNLLTEFRDKMANAKEDLKPRQRLQRKSRILAK